MAIYFGADHIVWAQQAGLINNKQLTDRAQKASLYGWFGGSLCTLASELYELAGGCYLGRPGPGRLGVPGQV
jgi:hypothetical protein